MHELVINLHMHTPYSDGLGSHTEIAQAALKAGLDAVIITDHNVYVDGLEDYHFKDDQRVLLLVGEEVHDQARVPQKNHLLVFNVSRELAPLAWNTQQLLENIRKNGGLSFLAHIIDPAAPAVGEGDLSWEDWDLNGYTGIELWNGMSEFKSLLKSKLHAIYYAYNPLRIAHGPSPKALTIWDELLANGKRVVAIGGSDAHALRLSLGPLRRTVFPYEFHFKSINTHLLTPGPLGGVLENDKQMIMEALEKGHAFIGYDLPASTRGFRFTAHGFNHIAQMGDQIEAQNGITFQIRLPYPTECRLLRNGHPIKTWNNRDTCTFITNEPGVYRVEVYIHYKGKVRGWIFSNPIYVRSE